MAEIGAPLLDQWLRRPTARTRFHRSRSRRSGHALSARRLPSPPRHSTMVGDCGSDRRWDRPHPPRGTTDHPFSEPPSSRSRSSVQVSGRTRGAPPRGKTFASRFSGVPGSQPTCGPWRPRPPPGRGTPGRKTRRCHGTTERKSGRTGQNLDGVTTPLGLFLHDYGTLGPSGVRPPVTILPRVVVTLTLEHAVP